MAGIAIITRKLRRAIVCLSRPGGTGFRPQPDVILSKKPADWNSFFTVIESGAVPADFLDHEERDPFLDWIE